ncbi:MAG: ABC transporter permease [Victivallales bacterium]|nr:ABC transporter permease [Victivallales bacterium]
MKLPIDLFLALRYLRPKRTFVSFITLLSILGPALGVAVLIIVNSIMQGFQKNIKESIMSWQAHMHVMPVYSATYSEDEVTRVMEAMASNGITAAPIIQDNALVQIKHGSNQSCFPKIVYGINPKYERAISGILNNRFVGTFDITEKQAIIGWRMAQNLGLNIGDQFLLHSPKRLTENVKFDDDGKLDVGNVDEIYLPERVTVVGLFDMGISDLDDNVIYMHIDQVADLLGYEWRSATSIQGKVADPMNMRDIVIKLNAALNSGQGLRRNNIVTWQERNAKLFETLRVEHILLLFLMTFILLVASFSIAATLITVVVKKTREIGVMKAMGIGSTTVARIFVLEGLIIGIIGSGLGTIIGALVVTYRTAVAAVISFIVGHEVFPAELYHLSEIPAEMTIGDLVGFNLLAIVICILSALLPSLFAAFMTPAKSLQES